MTRSYSDQDFEDAVRSSCSIRQVLIKLGLAPAGGNYALCKQRMEKLKLDISHFKGQSWKQGLVIGPRRPLEVYLNNQYPISSHALRQRLLREEVFKHKCYRCGRTIWNGLPIPLELEHIDGNHKNNSLSNLTLLCPNCHAQTSTYRGRNISS